MPWSAIRCSQGVTTTSLTPDGEAAATSGVEIELTSANPIPVRDALLTLQIAGHSFTISRFADDGSTGRAIFTLSRAAFDALPEGAPVVLQDGAKQASFGSLNKSALR